MFPEAKPRGILRVEGFVIPPNSKQNNTRMSVYDFIAKCYKSQ